MPPPGPGTKARLDSLREIQNYNYPRATPSATAPDFCLAAARFVAAKLVGLLKESQHLNGFLDSPEAKSSAMSRADLSLAWGKLTTLKDFNEKALPAAIGSGGKRASAGVEFVHAWNDSMKADQFLAQRVPIVCGISLGGGSSRDHFVVLVAGSAGSVWLVDSWGETGSESSVQVPKPFTFSKPIKVTINAGDAIVPSANPFFGYFRDSATGDPLKTSIAL